MRPRHQVEADRPAVTGGRDGFDPSPTKTAWRTFSKPERQHELREQIKNGIGTVRELRAERKKTTATVKPGPKPFTHTYKPDDKTFTVSVKFRKSEPTRDEIRTALEKALANVT